MSIPSTPYATNLSPHTSLAMADGTKDSKAVISSPERDFSPAATTRSSDSSSDGSHEPQYIQPAIVDAFKVPISRRINKYNKDHIEDSMVTMNMISKGGIKALNKRPSLTESDTSPLSDAPSSDPDWYSDDADTAHDDPEMQKSVSDIPFDKKTPAAISQAYQNKTQSKSTPKHAASKKHRITPPVSGSSTKKGRPITKRDRSAEASLEVQKLPYQSIISLLMPPRPGLIPNQPVPEPDPANLPFGDTEDYHNSMIIHYMDECEMTYTKAAEVYSEKFPRDAVTDEAVRKRHIRSLLRLKTKYGCRDVDTIPRPSQAVVRRGTPRAKKVSLIVPVDANAPASAAPQSSLSASAPVQVPLAEKKRKLPPRLLEKVLIVTWRDDAKLSWKDIQNELEDKYKWSLGQGTIEKYYYSTLDRVYGKDNKKEKNAEAPEEKRGKPEGEELGGFLEREVERRMSF